MSHRTTIRVRFYELDPYEHVNHSVYIQYFEAARVEWLTAIGFPLERLKREGFQIFVTEIHTRYLSSAGPSDELIVESELADIKRVGMTFRQRIMRGDEVLVEQTLNAAMVTTAGRLTRIPGELADALRDGP